jgi:hypothetical protein
MRPRQTVKSSSQDFRQKNLVLLKRARRGDRTAQKKLRNLGLQYWEHQGRVIVKRVCATNGERHGAIPWSFSHKQI